MGACRFDSRGCTMLAPSSGLAAGLFAFQSGINSDQQYKWGFTPICKSNCLDHRQVAVDAARQSVESSPSCDRSAGVGCSVACSS